LTIWRYAVEQYARCIKVTYPKNAYTILCVRTREASLNILIVYTYVPTENIHGFFVVELK